MDEAQRWNSRGHFFAAAAEAMRRILVDKPAASGAPKHGGGLQRVELADGAIGRPATPDDDLWPLDEALDSSAEDDPAAAELVKLRFFAGLTLEEAADVPRHLPRDRRPATGLTPGPGCSQSWQD